MSAGGSCRKKRATPWPQGEGAPQGASGVLFTATPSGGCLSHDGRSCAPAADQDKTQLGKALQFMRRQ